MSKQIDNIAKQLSIKYNLTETIVDKIIDCQFKFLMKEMESGELNSVMLQHIGKWYIPITRKHYMKYKLIPKLKAKKDANGTDSTK